MGQKIIVSIFMDNIHPKTVELHKLVLNKMNKTGARVVYAKTTAPHAETMDSIWKAPALKEFDSILFLDIDAVPLHPEFFRYMFDTAEMGYLVGNAQATNHINNGKHLFVAPSALCMSRKTFSLIGSPSAVPTVRGDVAEEYTWAAEEHEVECAYLKPVKWDRPVNRMAWEQDRSSTWKLPDGTEYAIGTTFQIEGHSMNSLVWHSFQSYHPGNQEATWKKMEEVLK